MGGNSGIVGGGPFALVTQLVDQCQLAGWVVFCITGWWWMVNQPWGQQWYSRTWSICLGHIDGRAVSACWLGGVLDPRLVVDGRSALGATMV